VSVKNRETFHTRRPSHRTKFSMSANHLCQRRQGLLVASRQRTLPGEQPELSTSAIECLAEDRMRAGLGGRGSSTISLRFLSGSRLPPVVRSKPSLVCGRIGVTRFFSHVEERLKSVIDRTPRERADTKRQAGRARRARPAGGGDRRIARTWPRTCARRTALSAGTPSSSSTGSPLPPAPTTELIDAARRALLERGWDLAVVVTDLPCDSPAARSHGTSAARMASRSSRSPRSASCI
jgi:hypothetical protein